MVNPIIRINTLCGTDQNISAGREPCQGGWYEWAGYKFCRNKTVLDVGAGMCDGINILRNAGAYSVSGQDIDHRLEKINSDIIISDISDISKDSYDIITCFDVIEHVIDDEVFFKNLMRISKEVVIITTPNFARSMAGNHYHCREYTIPQFVNCFDPNELWAASPDGRVHHTLLLKKCDNKYVDCTRDNVIYDMKVPDDLTFNHSTVDGQEWAHMCGIKSKL